MKQLWIGILVLCSTPSFAYNSYMSKDECLTMKMTYQMMAQQMHDLAKNEAVEIRKLGVQLKALQIKYKDVPEAKNTMPKEIQDMINSIRLRGDMAKFYTDKYWENQSQLKALRC